MYQVTVNNVFEFSKHREVLKFSQLFNPCTIAFKSLAKTALGVLHRLSWMHGCTSHYR